MRGGPTMQLGAALVATHADEPSRVPLAWGSSRGAEEPGGWLNQLCGEQRAFLASTGSLHEIGDHVVIHSLSAVHGLNGKWGHIYREMDSTGRRSWLRSRQR